MSDKQAVDEVLGSVPEQCKRCGKRMPSNPDWSKDWNITWVASYATGYVCPDCQTDDEDLEAQVRDEVDPPLEVIHINDEATFDRYQQMLLRSYPTPELMRSKSDELEAARPDCALPVALMRSLADYLETKRR